MHSRRALGIIALAAVVVSAISFAVVDVSIANANGCVGSAVPCADRTIPVIAITFGLLGVFALLGSIVPALSWFTQAMQHARLEEDHEHDELDGDSRAELAHRALSRRLVFEEPE